MSLVIAKMVSGKANEMVGESKEKNRNRKKWKMLEIIVSSGEYNH